MPSHTPNVILICSNSQCDFQSEPWTVSEEVCPQCGADLDEVESRPQRLTRTPARRGGCLTIARNPLGRQKVVVAHTYAMTARRAMMERF